MVTKTGGGLAIISKGIPKERRRSVGGQPICYSASHSSCLSRRYLLVLRAGTQ